MIWDYLDEDENGVEPVGENPFAPKVFPMSSKWSIRMDVAVVAILTNAYFRTMEALSFR
jgi:hypothetical protein